MTDQEKIIAQIQEMYPDYQIVVIVFNEEGDIHEFGHGCRRCASEVLHEVANKGAESEHNSDERIH